uniref:Anaphase-promoting complex subunit 4 WD40 domain-containing protein n=1 Tax=Chrysotila carterae TaxID=13221 RepID=A0A7S4BAX0_CHRCT|mmetsp:Transcript_37556/g.82628  ORF Transcript_37556/g.82628 Transcript_37556/m.82628 type:complete len:146 (+) Transcript_37556:161-598(+)
MRFAPLSFSDNCNVYLYSPSGALQHTLSKHRGAISALAFSAGSEQLASGCANKEIVVWDPRAGTPLVLGMQGYHTARITCLQWSAGSVLASGGVDATINVWDLTEKKPKQQIKLAHQGGVTAIAFVSEGTLASAGLDACIKTWTV